MMETFTREKPFVFNPGYLQDRLDTITALDLKSIDKPIVDIVAALAELAHCFPLQSCCGHFVCRPGQGLHTLEPIPEGFAGPVRYRIAYIALCIENSRPGRALRESLAEIPEIDSACIQFGSADWFWKQFPNSYVLQVEPADYQEKDEATLEVSEAIHLQVVRDQFFDELRNVLRRHLAIHQK